MLYLGSAGERSSMEANTRKAAETDRSQGTGDHAPLGAALFTLRSEMAHDLPKTIEALAQIGYHSVEPICWGGAESEYREMLLQTGVPRLQPTKFRTILDYHGMQVSSAHVQLFDAGNAAEVLDEQEELGNRLLVVPTPRLVPGFASRPFDREMLHALAERFAIASELAAARGMRVGYHTHREEFDTMVNGEPVLDELLVLLDRRVFVQLDVTWMPKEIADPAEVVGRLNDRLLLLHCRGRLSFSLGRNSSIVCRTVDLGTVQGDPWPALRAAHDDLTAVDG
jgi:sugar phosphate isomerase/epimerase